MSWNLLWNLEPFKKKINCFSITNFGTPLRHEMSWNLFRNLEPLQKKTNCLSIANFGTPLRHEMSWNLLWNLEPLPEENKLFFYHSFGTPLRHEISCYKIWNPFKKKTNCLSIANFGTPLGHEMSWSLSRNSEHLLHKKCLEIYHEIWSPFYTRKALKFFPKFRTLFT